MTPCINIFNPTNDLIITLTKDAKCFILTADSPGHSMSVSSWRHSSQPRGIRGENRAQVTEENTTCDTESTSS